MRRAAVVGVLLLLLTGCSFLSDWKPGVVESVAAADEDNRTNVKLVGDPKVYTCYEVCSILLPGDVISFQTHSYHERFIEVVDILERKPG